jgi:hypothetical protein
MWIIKEIKRDVINISMFLLGTITIMYLVMGQFDFYFLKYITNMFIAVMSLGTIMLMRNSVGKSTNNIFKFLAISYRYIAILVIVIMMVRNHYGAYLSRAYIKARIGTDLFEIMYIIMAYTYLKKEFHAAKIYTVTALTFAIILCLFLTPNFMDYEREDLISVFYVVELFITGLVIWTMYLNEYLIGVFDKRIPYRMYLFLAFKCIYHILSICYIYNDTEIIYSSLVIFRFIYTYQLMVCIFCERIALPWDTIMQKVKVTDRRLDDNEKDRTTIINLSHELKTPINVIQSATEVLGLDLNEEQDQEMTKLIQEIRVNCYRSTKLITNIIDNNKLDEGCITPKYIEGNLIFIVQNILAALSRYNAKWSIRLDTKQEELYAEVDEELVQRSILNIIALLLSYQKSWCEVVIYLKRMQDKVIISLNSAATILPKAYTDEEEESYTKQTINEIASFEFVKKVMEMHGGQLYLISNEQSGTTIFMELKLMPMVNKNPVVHEECEQNISLLLNRIKVQYADLP